MRRRKEEEKEKEKEYLHNVHWRSIHFILYHVASWSAATDTNALTHSPPFCVQ